MKPPALLLWLAAALVAAAAAPALRARAAQPAPGVVSHLKVVSDKVEDVSDLEAWKQSCIKPGMSDDQKAIALWKTVVKYRHQTAPPNEFLQNESNVHDVMKTIHVYGYGMCCCASANVEQLARYAGFEARGWAINVHSVPEVSYGGKWHLVDGSLMNWFRAPDGSIAGVEEISQAVRDWHEKNPGYRGNDGKLREFARNEGWKKGPPLLAACEWYTKDGPNAAGWHGWSSTLVEYDGKHNLYEYGYSQGYGVNVQLRPGERLTRNWFNKGMHINMDGGGDDPGDVLKSRAALGLQARFGDIAPGRIGNGALEYAVPLADGAFRAGALAAENLASKADDDKGPALHLKDPAAPGVLVLRMPSSYVYLGGEAAVKAVVGQGGRIDVSFSDNNGLDWRPVARIDASGDRALDLKPLCYRRYDYRLRFELAGAGTGLESLTITHDIQHSQRPLPALAQGANRIAFSAEPQEGTITIEGTTDPANRGKQVFYTDFHPERENIADDYLRPTQGTGHVTFPIETPGDMTGVRVGVYYRARDAKDAWNVQVSFDGGKTFLPVGRCEGPTRNHGKYFVFTQVPASCRAALVRFAGEQRNTAMIYQARVMADYREPHGGFRPVKVTYVWEEGGAEKRNVHVARKAAETYTIDCPTAPLMKSLVVELAE